jgi:hypothetical protein
VVVPKYGEEPPTGGCPTEKDLAALAKAIIDKAKTGDIPAIRELLDRILGRPVEADLLERLEALEQYLVGPSLRPHRESWSTLSVHHWCLDRVTEPPQRGRRITA